VCGSTDLDFNEWKKGAKYVDGYTENHDVIKWFWEILLEMEME
jgi:hypothetical protein